LHLYFELLRFSWNCNQMYIHNNNNNNNNNNKKGFLAIYRLGTNWDFHPKLQGLLGNFRL